MQRILTIVSVLRGALYPRRFIKPTAEASAHWETQFGDIKRQDAAKNERHHTAPSRAESGMELEDARVCVMLHPLVTVLPTPPPTGCHYKHSYNSNLVKLKTQLFQKRLF